MFLARGKKVKINDATWFLFANELFYIAITLGVLILTRFEYRLSQGILLFLLIAIGSFSFYGTKSWLIGQIEKRRIGKKYKSLQPKTALFTFMGAMLLLGSYILCVFTIIKTFQGYLL